jgi:hypothetical protein
LRRKHWTYGQIANGSMSAASKQRSLPFIVSVSGQSPAGHAAAHFRLELNRNRHHFPSNTTNNNQKKNQYRFNTDI